MQRDNSRKHSSSRRSSRKKGLKRTVKSVGTTSEHLRALHDDAIGCWKEGQAVVAKADQSSENRRIEILCIAYLFAIIAGQNAALMAEFFEHSFWKGGYKPKRGDILQRSIEFHFGCTTKKGPLYNRCRVYALALEQFFNKETPVTELPELIKKQGKLEEIYRQTYKRMQKARRKAKAAHEGTTSNDDRTDEDDVVLFDDNIVGKNQIPTTPNEGISPTTDLNITRGSGNKTGKSGNSGRAPRAHHIRLNYESEIVLLVNGDMMKDFLAKKVGDVGTIEFRIQGADSDGWLSASAISLE